MILDVHVYVCGLEGASSSAYLKASIFSLKTQSVDLLREGV